MRVQAEEEEEEEMQTHGPALTFRSIWQKQKERIP